MLVAQTRSPIVRSRSLRQALGRRRSSAICSWSLRIFPLVSLDGVKVEVDIPSTPSDAGLALGFLPANGGVDHKNEDDQQGQAVDGRGAPQGRQEIIDIQPSLVWHEAEDMVDLA